MSKWDGNKLVADEPKAKEKSILELLAEISKKLDSIIENTTPEGADS
jgi:hypothetical protein